MTVAKFISTYRVFPRLFVVTYFYYSVIVFEWFMSLPEPNEAQAAFAMMVGGGLVYAVKSYSTTGVEKLKVNSKFNNQ